MARMSIRELSKLTGYSVASISKALNNKPGVSEETRAAIEAAAKKHGYSNPHKLEQVTFLAARKNGKILDESNFHTQLIEGMQKEAEKLDLKTVFISLDVSNKEEFIRRAKELCNDPSSAIVVLGTELMEDDYQVFEEFKDQIVILDGMSDKTFFNSVVIANEDSTYKATQRLIDMGHRSIGYLAGDFRINAFRYRERGYLHAMADNGLTVNPQYRVTLGTKLSSARRDMRSWLIDNHSLPTAFIAENDVIASGVMLAMNQANIRIPEDVSIIGFDDVVLASVTNPPLSTIRVPKEAMGGLAVELIWQLKNNSSICRRKIEVATDYIERKSVASLN